MDSIQALKPPLEPFEPTSFLGGQAGHGSGCGSGSWISSVCLPASNSTPIERLGLEFGPRSLYRGGRFGDGAKRIAGPAGEREAFAGDHSKHRVLFSGCPWLFIGEVVDDHPGFVTMKPRVGGTRVVDMLTGEQLPRIC
jgi:hypothetical protein